MLEELGILTSAPAFGFEALSYEDGELEGYKFMFVFFERYQTLDFVEELIENGQVTFETFASFEE